jgi:hypothetical protein
MPAIASLEDLKAAQKEGVSIYAMRHAPCALLYSVFQQGYLFKTVTNHDSQITIHGYRGFCWKRGKVCCKSFISWFRTAVLFFLHKDWGHIPVSISSSYTIDCVQRNFEGKLNFE